MATLTETLDAHRFQEEQAPGLYPEQPTVCSCGMSPMARPEEGDWAWWTRHVVAEMDGTPQPERSARKVDGEWVLL